MARGSGLPSWLGTCAPHLDLPCPGQLPSTALWEQVSFVDLAGSERVKDTKASGEMLKETSSINRSLFTLGKACFRPPPPPPVVPVHSDAVVQVRNQPRSMPHPKGGRFPAPPPAVTARPHCTARGAHHHNGSTLGSALSRL